MTCRQLLEAFAKQPHATTLPPNLAANALAGVYEMVGEFISDLVLEGGDELLGDRHVMVGRDAHAEPEFGVVFEQ